MIIGEYRLSHGSDTDKDAALQAIVRASLDDVIEDVVLPRRALNAKIAELDANDAYQAGVRKARAALTPDSPLQRIRAAAALDRLMGNKLDDGGPER